MLLPSFGSYTLGCKHVLTGFRALLPLERNMSVLPFSHCQLKVGKTGVNPARGAGFN